MPENSIDDQTEGQRDQEVFSEAPDARVRDYGIEDFAALVFFWGLATVVSAQVFTRYVLNDSMAWTEEIARYLLVCVTFVGSAMALRKRSHIAVTYFQSFLPPPFKRVVSFLNEVSIILFLLIAAVLTFQVMGGVMHNRMASVPVPLGLLYAVVLAGWLSMAIRAVQITLRRWNADDVSSADSNSGLGK